MDLDRDGRSDILTGSWPGEIYWFRGEGAGKFVAGQIIQNADGEPIDIGHASTPFAVDWDGNGALDLLVGNINGEVQVLLNKGNHKELRFGEPRRLAAGGEPIAASGGDSAPIAADWDADGRLDLLLGAGDGSVVWFRNIGNTKEPKLETAKPLVKESPIGWGDDNRRRPGEWGLRVKPCAVDWNGDGRLDLLLGDRCGGFQAKPSQSADEVQQELAAHDKLPELRKQWAKAFQEFRQQTATEEINAPESPAAVELAATRERLRSLKDEIARVQEIQAHYAPGYQSHGFVWLFLRK